MEPISLTLMILGITAVVLVGVVVLAMKTSAKTAIGVVFGVMAVALVIAYVRSEADTKTNPQETTARPAPAPAKHVYTDEQKSGAQVLMSAVKANHTVYEEGSHLVVQMRQIVEDRNALLRFATRVADADCILNGGPRNIYFYDPSMHQVAQADTLNGIRLKN